MSDTAEDEREKNTLICIPCRCKRQLYHKETKTVKENDKLTTNTFVDKRNLKFGCRNVSPDEILKHTRKTILWIRSLKFQQLLMNVLFL